MFKKQLIAIALGACSATSAMAVPVHAGNGHWYEYIATNVDWGTAFAAASASTYLGMQGYLATITSAAENAHIASTVTGGALAWIGGSDAGNPINFFTWRGGPEIGQAFTYTNWATGEPNNCCGGENYVHINFGGLGKWNDHGGPGNPGQINGYVVEYNGVPEPTTLALLLGGLAIGGFARRGRATK